MAILVTCTEPEGDKPLPHGHVCQIRIADAEEAIAQKSGDDMFKLRLDCLSPEGTVDSTVWSYITFGAGDFATKIRKDFLISIGLWQKEGDQFELSDEELLGKTGTVRLKQTEYNGELRNEVAKWLPPTGAQLN